MVDRQALIAVGRKASDASPGGAAGAMLRQQSACRPSLRQVRAKRSLRVAKRRYPLMPGAMPTGSAGVLLGAGRTRRGVANRRRLYGAAPNPDVEWRAGLLLTTSPWLHLRRGPGT